jgi:hypothetical protein
MREPGARAGTAALAKDRRVRGFIEIIIRVSGAAGGVTGVDAGGIDDVEKMAFEDLAGRAASPVAKQAHNPRHDSRHDRRQKRADCARRKQRRPPAA